MFFLHCLSNDLSRAPRPWLRKQPKRVAVLHSCARPYLQDSSSSALVVLVQNNVISGPQATRDLAPGSQLLLLFLVHVVLQSRGCLSSA
jgi:hypothetical protein